MYIKFEHKSLPQLPFYYYFEIDKNNARGKLYFKQSTDCDIIIFYAYHKCSSLEINTLYDMLDSQNLKKKEGSMSCCNLIVKM